MTRREKLAAAMRENIQAMKEGRPIVHKTIRLADFQDDPEDEKV